MSNDFFAKLAAGDVPERGKSQSSPATNPGPVSSVAPVVTPFPSPKTPPPPAGAHNLWRDGKLLVVVGPSFSFPPRCVKTGSTENLFPKSQQIKYLPNTLAIAAFGGAIGLLIAQALWGQTIQMTVPVSNEWQRSKERRMIGGLLVMLAGGLMFFVGLVALVMIDPSGPLAAVGPILPLAGMVLGFAGMIYMLVARPSTLFSVHRIDGTITWLKGAAPEFLATLPEWSTTGPIGAQGVFRRS